jgi:hypothetical protein
MSHAVATAGDAGRVCPYCRFPLKQGASAERCNACGALHHDDCWRDGGGCAVLGCPAARRPVAETTAASASARTASTLAPPAHVSDVTGATHTQQFANSGPPPSNGPRAGVPTLVVATLVALVGILAGVLIASGTLASSPRGSAAAPATPVSSKHEAPLSATQIASDRDEMFGVLSAYQHDYTNHDLQGLSQIFTPDVKRHGLAANGCQAVEGRQAVLAAYESQFDEGTGAYVLVGLQPTQIAMDGPARAHVSAHYAISTGGSGFVNFSFANVNGWKIDQIDATCA